MFVARRIVEDHLPNVVVIGAGITGLTAAYRIQKSAQECGTPLRVMVLESSSECGGVIRTLRNEYGTLEEGPEAFVAYKPAALELIKELGLGDQLIVCSKTADTTFVARGDQLEPLPQGFMMFAPTRLSSLASSRLFSWAGKLRMAMDLLLPARLDESDESLADFVTRRLGREALERLAEPLIAGIYSTDAHRLSANCAVPRLKQLERDHGSVIRGLLQAKRATSSGGPLASGFLSLHNGMQSLTDTLASVIGADSIRLNAPVHSVGPGLRKRWRVLFGNGQQSECDAVVIATPARIAAKLLKDISVEAAHELAGIEYGTTAMVSLVYKRDSIAHAMNGSGFVVPSLDAWQISACSFSSVKFPSRTKEDYVLLRAFSRSAINDDLDATRKAVVRDLTRFLGITGEPIYAQVALPKSGLPKYTVGHQERVERILRCLSQHLGLAIAGNSYHGVGIPDCVASAEAAARQIMKQLQEQRVASGV